MVVSETHSQAANCLVIGGLEFPPARVLLAAWGFNSILTTPSLSSPPPPPYKIPFSPLIFLPHPSLSNSSLSPFPSPFSPSLSLSPTHTEWIQQSGLHLLTARQLWNWCSGKFKFYTEVHPSLVPKPFPPRRDLVLAVYQVLPSFPLQYRKAGEGLVSFLMWLTSRMVERV